MKYEWYSPHNQNTHEKILDQSQKQLAMFTAYPSPRTRHLLETASEDLLFSRTLILFQRRCDAKIFSHLSEIRPFIQACELCTLFINVEYCTLNTRPEVHSLRIYSHPLKWKHSVKYSMVMFILPLFIIFFDRIGYG